MTGRLSTTVCNYEVDKNCLHSDSHYVPIRVSFEFHRTRVSKRLLPILTLGNRQGLTVPGDRLADA